MFFVLFLFRDVGTALSDTEHVPFLCRLASPKRARNLTMSTFGREQLSWWFSISFNITVFWHRSILAMWNIGTTVKI
jgi:hypothetical protein